MSDSDKLGIVPDGRDISKALVKALESEEKVVLSEGVYSTAPIAITKKAHLVLEKGAVLRFIPDFDLYEPVFTRWEGVKCWCLHPCLYIHDAEDVIIEGEGTIDGSGERWWKECLSKRGKGCGPASPLELKLAALNPTYKDQANGGGGREFQFLRPPLIQIAKSRNVTLSGITVMNSPFWTIHPLFSRNLTLTGLKVINPADAPNTDGIDIESCSHVLVENCFVHVGDDGIALKSGSRPDGISDNVPTQDIIIRGCTVKEAHGGAVIGSETAAEISNLVVEDCLFDGTDRGIRIKTRRGRGGLIHDLTFRNITMKGNLCPFVINMYYRCGIADSDTSSVFSLDKEPVDEFTPVIHSILIENCTCIDSKASAGMAVGLPESPVRNVVIRNSTFTVAEDASVDVDESDMYKGLPTPPSRGFRLRNIEIKLEDVKIVSDGEGIIKEDGAVLL